MKSREMFCLPYKFISPLIRKDIHIYLSFIHSNSLILFHSHLLWCFYNVVVALNKVYFKLYQIFMWYVNAFAKEDQFTTHMKVQVAQKYSVKSFVLSVL